MNDNEYLREFIKACGPEALTHDRFWMPVLASLPGIFRAREVNLFRFAFAVPNDEAIAVCVKHSPIIEVGAGGGYWARLIRLAGGNIIATDIEPGKPYGTLVKNGDRLQMWIDDIQQCDAANAATAYPNRTLMLCWPPYNDDMAERALAVYQGQRVIYIGEWDGCTATEAFHDALEAQWTEIESVKIPNWWGIHDTLWVYERKQQRRRIKLGDKT